MLDFSKQMLRSVWFWGGLFAFAMLWVDLNNRSNTIDRLQDQALDDWAGLINLFGSLVAVQSACNLMQSGFLTRRWLSGASRLALVGDVAGTMVWTSLVFTGVFFVVELFLLAARYHDFGLPFILTSSMGTALVSCLAGVFFHCL